MLKLIKSRRESESFNQSLGLFNVNIFQSDQDHANQTLEKDSWSSKIRILYTALPEFTNNLEVWWCFFVLLMGQ